MCNLGPDDEKTLDSSAFELPFSINKIGRTCEGGKISCDEPVALVEAAQVGRDGDQGGADNGNLGCCQKNADTKASCPHIAIGELGTWPDDGGQRKA